MNHMNRIDNAIANTSKAICENISLLELSDRGLISQNILQLCRNFVEYVAIKAYSNGQDLDPHNQQSNKDALNFMKKTGDLKFLYKFHDMLQKSTSHYTFDKDGSERLMLKYYEYLLKIKVYLKNNFNLNVLDNIEKFPLNTDTELYEYYEKIAEKIESKITGWNPDHRYERFYVQKVKPFFINQNIYYEITFTAAIDNISKFDRIIAFTKQEIVENYAVEFLIRNESIRILDKEMPILIIDAYKVSIRPCEFSNLSKIFGDRVPYSDKSNEYKELMNYLSTVKLSLTELVSSDQEYYDYVKMQITSSSQSVKIFNTLDRCREIVTNNKPGSNILRYLLYKMNNRTIKMQYSYSCCESLSNLHLEYGCIPFDEMPYCSSLKGHNPKIYDLFDCISTENREHELFARYINNNTEIEGKLFTPKTDIKGFENIDELVNSYNARLYYKHSFRQIKEHNNHLFIKKYADDSTEIIRKLQELSSSGVSQYTVSVDSWLQGESYAIDDENKKTALRYMFADSHVALIYGSAGTGKSTLIRHISNFWANSDKLFLANTHPAVDNMRRKINVGKSEYKTIASFLSKGNKNVKCDILFVDECSTVSNEDMRKVLEKADFKLLVLVGDIFQIESIYFGNWFSIAQKFVPKSSIFELTHPYRTNNDNLLCIWDRVRKLDSAILEMLIKNDSTSRLDRTIFERNEDDEIVLCLNYDGLYGINNINRLLQSNNPNKSVEWGINTYKVGDPILFNESNAFCPLIHNNSKGIIKGIRLEKERIWFDIEIDEVINEINAYDYGFKLIGVSEAGKSVISFSVNKHRINDEEDDDNDSTIVPFQVAYAVSIHKAQGLEYNSVKIIITNEVEERITHSIFYTAITRAKNKLKIYWSPETERFVLSNLKIKDSKKDAVFLSQLASIEMMK